jgi:type-F conjugative transfer system pilin assembly protein TrbC
MAQKKLLCILISVICLSLKADEVMKMNQKVLETNFPGLFKPEIGIKVYVSTSMPMVSVKQYFLDSARYNAFLVIKGLPEGKFLALQSYMMKISNNEKIEGNFVLDENSFNDFNITQVPTIVLYKERCCATGKCEVVFDKISGNITLESALKEFTKSGELKEEADRILKEAGR